MPRKTKEEAAATRLSLLNAALVLFDQQGPEKTSVKQVAIQAKVTHGAFYWHFKNREELVHALYSEKALVLDTLYFEYLQASHQNGLLALKDYTCAWIKFVLADHQRFLVWRLFYRPDAPLAQSEGVAAKLAEDQGLWQERVVSLAKRAKKQKRLNTKYIKSMSKLARVISAMVNGILAEQITTGDSSLAGAEREQLWQSQLDIFFAGLAR